MQLTLSTGKRK